MIHRFVSNRHPFFILTDGKEYRFAPVYSATAEEMWETAVPAKLLDKMLDEYNRMQGKV